jgi:predicted RNA-binding Zn ribbon-like protein
MPMAKDFVFFGRLCLDFAHTGDMGYGDRFERLRTPSDLCRWLSISPLGLPNVRISLEDLELAKQLRGSLWRVASALLDRVAPKASDVRLINLLGRKPCLVRELAAAAQSLRWRQPTIEAALATLSQDAIMLFGESEQRSRIRSCENAGCRAIFYDDSRPGLRRWCASSRCGDRTRAKRYRDRQQLQQIGT